MAPICRLVVMTLLLAPTFHAAIWCSDVTSLAIPEYGGVLISGRINFTKSQRSKNLCSARLSQMDKETRLSTLFRLHKAEARSRNGMTNSTLGQPRPLRVRYRPAIWTV